MSQVVAQVTTLFRYPVKSMQGELVDSLDFSGGPPAGDRQWALADPAAGMWLSAKRHGQLLEASARTESEGEVIVTLPDRSDVVLAELGAEARLSDWLGRPVELRRPSAHESPTYESLGDPLDESSPTQTFSGPTTHFADFAEVHLLTTASLRAATALHPAGDWDVRRFRPTALLDAAEKEGYVEDEWVGSRLTMGATAAFEVFMKTIRCNLPTRAQPGLERDAAVARVLRDEHEFCLGVYAAQRVAGVVRVGDSVSLA